MNTCYSGFTTNGTTCCPPNTTGFGPTTPFGASNWFNTWSGSNAQCAPSCGPFGFSFPGFQSSWCTPNTGWGFAPNGSFGNFAPDCCGPNGCNGNCTYCWTPMGCMPIASPNCCVPTCATLPNGCTVCGFCVNGCFVPTSAPMSSGTFASNQCPPTWNSWTNCPPNTGTFPMYSAFNGCAPGFNGTWSGTGYNGTSNWANSCPPSWTNQWSNRFGPTGSTNCWTPMSNFGGFPGCDTACPPFGWNGFPPMSASYCGPMGCPTPQSAWWCPPTNACYAPPMNGSWMQNFCPPTSPFGSPFNANCASPFGGSAQNCPPSSTTPSAFANVAKPFGGSMPNPANPGASNCGDVCCPPLSRSAA